MNEEEQKQEDLQEKLEKLWGERMWWREDPVVEEVKLPEGMRLVELTGEEFLVLRSIIPGSPRNEKTGEMMDVPVAIFTHHMTQEAMEKFAEELYEEVAKGHVHYIPPEKEK